MGAFGDSVLCAVTKAGYVALETTKQMLVILLILGFDSAASLIAIEDSLT